MLAALSNEKNDFKKHFKVSWYPKIDHVFEKYTSVIFR